MPKKEDEAFHLAALGLGGPDDEEATPPTGEEIDDSGEGEEDGSPDIGSDSGSDETEDEQGGEDGLETREDEEDGEDDEPPAKPNGKDRRSQSSWARREAKHQEELAARQRALDEAEARIRKREEEEQRASALAAQQRNAQDEERRALLTPEERNAEDIANMRAQLQFEQRMREFNDWDARDKSEYYALANSDSAMGKIFKKNAETIEKHLKDCRARNTNMPRHVLLRYEIGDQVLKAMANNKPSTPQKSRKAPKPPTSRGDAGRTPARSNPSSESEARRKRLEGVRL